MTIAGGIRARPGLVGADGTRTDPLEQRRPPRRRPRRGRRWLIAGPAGSARAARAPAAARRRRARHRGGRPRRTRGRAPRRGRAASRAAVRSPPARRAVPSAGTPPGSRREARSGERRAGADRRDAGGRAGAAPPPAARARRRPRPAAARGAAARRASPNPIRPPIRRRDPAPDPPAAHPRPRASSASSTEHDVRSHSSEPRRATVTGRRRLGRGGCSPSPLLVCGGRAADRSPSPPRRATTSSPSAARSAPAPRRAGSAAQRPLPRRALCGSDAGLQAFHDAAASGLWHFGAWVWRAPPGTVFTDVQANASLTAPGRPPRRARRRPARRRAGRVRRRARRLSRPLDPRRVHPVPQLAALRRPGRRASRAGGPAATRAHAYVRGVYLRTEDRAAPGLRSRGGSLLGAEVVRGVRGLTFGAWPTSAAASARSTSRPTATQLVTDVRNCAVAAGFATALQPCPLRRP